jgi:hypothetical protein
MNFWPARNSTSLPAPSPSSVTIVPACRGGLAEAARDGEQLVGRLLDLAVGVVDYNKNLRHLWLLLR